MKEIVSSIDLEEVRSLPRAFVFIYVGWAIQARRSQATFREFAAAWNSSEPDLPTPVYRVDLSNQEGEIWEAIRLWLRAQNQPFDELTYSGCGALLWVRLGSVIESVLSVEIVEKANLFAISKRIFGEHP
jgi:hypothetical protein